MFYTESFKEKLLHTLNDTVLLKIGLDKKELKKRLECEDPFIGRIIAAARYSSVGATKTNLNELYAEWEKIFFDPKNGEWAQSFPYQEQQKKSQTKHM